MQLESAANLTVVSESQSVLKLCEEEMRKGYTVQFCLCSSDESSIVYKQVTSFNCIVQLAVLTSRNQYIYNQNVGLSVRRSICNENVWHVPKGLES